MTPACLLCACRCASKQYCTHAGIHAAHTMHDAMQAELVTTIPSACGLAHDPGVQCKCTYMCNVSHCSTLKSLMDRGSRACAVSTLQHNSTKVQKVCTPDSNHFERWYDPESKTARPTTTSTVCRRPYLVRSQQHSHCG